MDLLGLSHRFVVWEVGSTPAGCTGRCPFSDSNLGSLPFLFLSSSSQSQFSKGRGRRYQVYTSILVPSLRSTHLELCRANWLGVHEAMVSMSWYGNLTLNNTALTNWTIDGTPVASIKTVDSFTFRCVFCFFNSYLQPHRDLLSAAASSAADTTCPHSSPARRCSSSLG